MRGKCQWVALLAALLSSAPALGQPPVDKSPSERLTSTGGRAADAQKPAGIYEDVEIMRRLLNRALTESYSTLGLFGMRRVDYLQSQIAKPASDPVIGLYRSWTSVDALNVTNPTWAPGAQAPANLVQLDAAGQTANQYWQPSLLLENPRWAEVSSWAAQRLPLTTEGAYLKGHGVVFTITLPPHEKIEQEIQANQKLASGFCAKCHDQNAQKLYEEAYRALIKASEEKSAKAESRVPDAWEQTRREVRGVKEEPKKEAPPAPVKKQIHCGPSVVAETILRVLAENGKHFTQLGPEEHLTVVITFRPWNRPGNAANDSFWLDLGFPAANRPNCSTGAALADFDNDGRLDLFVANNVTGAANLYRNLGNGKFEDLTAQAGVPVDGASNQKTPSEAGAGAAKSDQEEVKKAVDKAVESLKRTQFAGPRDYELLGDLHMKQKRYEEAIRAYEQAVRENPTSVALRSKHLEALKSHVDATQKQLEVDKPKLEEMRKQLIEAMQEYANALGGKKKEIAPPAPPPAPALPVKLTISAPKKFLDQVGQGKMSLEDFQKAVTIEYYQPSAGGDRK